MKMKLPNERGPVLSLSLTHIQTQLIPQRRSLANLKTKLTQKLNFKNERNQNDVS